MVDSPAIRRMRSQARFIIPRDQKGLEESGEEMKLGNTNGVKQNIKPEMH